MTILLRNNTKRVRDELKRMGYELCPCCYYWRGCDWIFVYYGRAHGVSKYEHKDILDCNKITDCKTDKQMFLNLAKKMMR